MGQHCLLDIRLNFPWSFSVMACVWVQRPFPWFLKIPIWLVWCTLFPFLNLYKMFSSHPVWIWMQNYTVISTRNPITKSILDFKIYWICKFKGEETAPLFFNLTFSVLTFFSSHFIFCHFFKTLMYHRWSFHNPLRYLTCSSFPHQANLSSPIIWEFC